MAVVSVDVAATQGGLSSAQEAVVSWGTSSLLHVGVGLILLTGAYMVGKQSPKVEEHRLIPVATSDYESPLPTLPPPKPYGKPEISDPFAPADKTSPIAGAPPSIVGKEGDRPVDFISSGPQAAGSPWGVKDSNLISDGTSPIGRPGAPRDNLFEPGTRLGGRPPRKIVFVLDHSGSMLDSFDYLRDEVKRVVKGYTPVQQFSVIMFSDTVQVLGPESLVRATPQGKQDLYDRLDQVRAGGRNDDLLDPFSKALSKAFAMKPEVIVFLTDGKFDPRLPTAVAGMNKDKSVKLNTIAFVKIDPQSEEQLRAIAADSGGSYKFVSQKDLSK